MKRWDIKKVEFEPGIWEEIERFVGNHPQYRKMIQERINDLMEFPDLFWQSAHIRDENHGYFLTRNQQIELAGKVYRKESLIRVTHFSFHT